MRPRQRPYRPSRLPGEPVIVDVEHRLVALGADRPPAAGYSDTGADYAATRPALGEFWPTRAPARRAMPDNRGWQVTSLGEWEAAGMALGDGPAGPEAIAGATRSRSTSRRSQRKSARQHRASADSLAWSGATVPAPSYSLPNATYTHPRSVPRPVARRWWLPVYLLLYGPFLLLGRVLSRGRKAIPRTVLILAVVTGILVTAAAAVELLHRIRTAAPTQVQPTAQVAEAPPGETFSTLGAGTAPAGVWVAVANTGGQGVYLRRQPDWSNKWVAWSEGTKLQLLAAGVSGTGAPSGSGADWLQVRDPEGRVGYVPEQFAELTSSP